MKDIFSDTSYGKAALAKLSPVPENFRLFEAGWLGKRPEEWTVMEVIGAEFREAKTGPNKGRMTIEIKGSRRTAHVTVDEMEKYEQNTPDS